MCTEHGEPDERSRVALSTLSTGWVLKDNYEAVVASQTDAAQRLSRQTWAQLQRFVQWVDLDKVLTMAILSTMPFVVWTGQKLSAKRHVTLSILSIG